MNPHTERMHRLFPELRSVLKSESGITLYNSNRFNDWMYLIGKVWNQFNPHYTVVQWEFWILSQNGFYHPLRFDPARDGPLSYGGLHVESGRIVVDDPTRVVLMTDHNLNPLVFETDLLAVQKELLMRYVE